MTPRGLEGSNGRLPEVAAPVLALGIGGVGTRCYTGRVLMISSLRFRRRNGLSKKR